MDLDLNVASSVTTNSSSIFFDGGLSAVSNASLNDFKRCLGQALAIFETLPLENQMDGLDILQHLVNKAVLKITHGRVTSVRFVPFQEESTQSSEINNRSVGNDGTPHFDSIQSESEAAFQHTIEIKSEPKESDIAASSSLVVSDLQPMKCECKCATDEKSQDSEFVIEIVESMADVTVKQENDESSVPRQIQRRCRPELKHQKGSKKICRQRKRNIHTVNDGTKVKPFKCQICPFSANRSHVVIDHMARHTGKGRWKCKICEHVATTRSSLRRHLLIHSGVKDYECSACEKRFYDPHTLAAHMVVHTGLRLFKCSQCDKSYSFSANLKRHQRGVHNGVQPYICPICPDVRYKDKSSLTLHILKHTGEKPHSCSVCEKKFKTSSDRVRHERIHSNERNYECMECGRAFRQREQLKSHMKSHSATPGGDFKCDQCDRSFRYKDSLRHHIGASHTPGGGKTHKCSICNKMLSGLLSLRNHKLVHTKEKPFSCRTCQRSFNAISNLKRHERIHSDVRNYRCMFCERAFKYGNCLRDHLKRHHKQETMANPGDVRVCKQRQHNSMTLNGCELKPDRNSSSTGYGDTRNSVGHFSSPLIGEKCLPRRFRSKSLKSWSGFQNRSDELLDNHYLPRIVLTRVDLDSVGSQKTVEETRQTSCSIVKHVNDGTTTLDRNVFEAITNIQLESAEHLLECSTSTIVESTIGENGLEVSVVENSRLGTLMPHNEVVKSNVVKDRKGNDVFISGYPIEEDFAEFVGGAISVSISQSDELDCPHVVIHNEGISDVCVNGN